VASGTVNQCFIVISNNIKLSNTSIHYLSIAAERPAAGRRTKLDFFEKPGLLSKRKLGKEKEWRF
jgi:hypothetical protein